jgi:uncharacterized protein DUF642
MPSDYYNYGYYWLFYRRRNFVVASTNQCSYINLVRLRTILSSAAIALLGVLSGHAQNLILNSDFEAGPHDPDSVVTNWTVSGTGFVHSAMEGATSGSYSAALSIGSNSEGNILSQSFATSIGQSYLLEFDAAVYGERSGGPLKLDVQALGSATLLDRTITPPDASTFAPEEVIFHHYRYTFTANSTTTTLRFTDIGLGNTDADIVIDTVSVVPTTIPAPTSLPLANGDFELGPYNMNGSVTGWSVTGAGRVSLLPQGSTSGSYSVALSSGGDYQDDILSQRFFTSAGQRYVLDFDAAVFGKTDSTMLLRLRVFGSGDFLDQILIPPYFGTFDPSEIHFQHYHFLFTADSSVSTLEFSDIGSANPDADIVIDTASIALTSPPSFADWQAAHFTPAQLNDPQISGWNADPDHDGIPNGLEFFFNTDPLAGITIADADSIPRVAIEIFDSSRYLTYTFRRLIGYAGSPAIVEVSDDLITWDSTGTQIEFVGPVVPSGDGVTEIVKVRLKTPIDQGPIPKKFLRLRLNQ